MSDASEAVLDALADRRIEFEKTPFPAGLLTVEEVASSLGIPAAQIVKAMLVVIEGQAPMIVGLPGDRRLDLDALEEDLDSGPVRLAKRSEIERISGVLPGAVTPLLGAVRDDLDVAIDRALLEETSVNVSSGDPSLGLALSPASLMAVSGAEQVDLGRGARGRR